MATSSDDRSSPSWMDVLDYLNMACVLIALIYFGVAGTLVFQRKHLEFNGIWQTRMVLVLAAACWVASFAIMGGHSASSTSRDEISVSGECQAYVLSKYGVFEPTYFLIILHIVKRTTSTDIDTNPSGSILLSSMLWWSLYMGFHLAVALFGVFGPLDSDFNETYLYAQGTNEYGICHLAMGVVILNTLFNIGFIVTYAIHIRLVKRVAINGRLLQVLMRLEWCALVLLPGTVACRVTFVILDNVYSGQYDQALQVVMSAETFLNTLSAILGVWVFVWRPVQDAAIQPWVRTLYSSWGPQDQTEDVPETPHAGTYMNSIKMEQIVENSLPPDSAPPSSIAPRAVSAVLSDESRRGERDETIRPLEKAKRRSRREKKEKEDVEGGDRSSKKKRATKKKAGEGGENSVEKPKKPRKRREKEDKEDKGDEDEGSRLNDSKVTVRTRSTKKKKKRKDSSDFELTASATSTRELSAKELAVNKTESETNMLNDQSGQSAGHDDVGDHTAGDGKQH